MNKKTAILLVNLGSPSAPTAKAVRRFLKQFLWDKRVVNIPRPVWWVILHCFVLTFRPKKSAHAYQAIWTEHGSPLTLYTRALTEKLAKSLPDYTVDYAMRYGEPSIASQLRKFKAAGISDVVVLPLYPQYSSTTTASVYDDLIAEFNQQWHIPSFKFISDYHDNTQYIEALADSIKQSWQEHGKRDLLLLSFHGVPAFLTKKGDPYFYHCQKTAELLAEKLGLAEHQWRLVFQSRFGKAEWLKPYCVETLQSLPKEGITSVDVVCAGFSVDCLETLEEIAITNKELFIEAGGKDYHYIPALNDTDDHVQVLMNIIGRSSSA